MDLGTHSCNMKPYESSMGAQIHHSSWATIAKTLVPSTEKIYWWYSVNSNDSWTPTRKRCCPAKSKMPQQSVSSDLEGRALTCV